MRKWYAGRYSLISLQPLIRRFSEEVSPWVERAMDGSVKHFNGSDTLPTGLTGICESHMSHKTQTTAEIQVTTIARHTRSVCCPTTRDRHTRVKVTKPCDTRPPGTPRPRAAHIHVRASTNSAPAASDNPQSTSDRPKRGPHHRTRQARKHRLQPRWPSDTLTPSPPARSRNRLPTVPTRTAKGSTIVAVGQLGLKAARHAACRWHHWPISVFRTMLRKN